MNSLIGFYMSSEVVEDGLPTAFCASSGWVSSASKVSDTCVLSALLVNAIFTDRPSLMIYSINW